jgi:quinoprotein glucose dehydrogenase
VNIDGGTAADPETGMIYVGSQSGMSTIRLQKDPCSEFRYSSVHDSCGLIGALPAPPGYTPPARGAGGGRRGGGGGGAAGGGAGGGGGARAGANAGAAAAGDPAAGFQTRASGTTINGVSILKVKELGGVTGYDMNTGDKKWWIPNGGFNPPPTIDAADPLFGPVKDKLPPVPPGGQPQVITTKTLVVYGTGRGGGARGAAPQIYAVDKATGKQVAAVTIPSKTTAVPMTFMHQGKQYIVFATGSDVNTALVALALPAK